MKALIEGALFPPVERKGSPPSRTRWPREEAVPRSRRGGGGGGQTWIHEQKLFCHSMLASFTAPLAGRATPLGEHRERPGRAAPVGVSRGSGRTVVLGVFSGNDHTSAYSRRGGEGGAPDPSQLHRPPLARRCRAGATTKRGCMACVAREPCVAGPKENEVGSPFLRGRPQGRLMTKPLFRGVCSRRW